MKKIIMLLMCIMLSATIYAIPTNNTTNIEQSTNTTDKWVEVESVTIPFGVEVHKGVTAKGNPKYWFVFEEIGTVYLSVSNYEKYINKTDYIELVKWQKGNKYKYTTRLRGKADINLKNIFK